MGKISFCLLLFAAAVSGCTGYTAYRSDAAAGGAPFENVTADACAGVLCEPSSIKCRDGSAAECSNTCANGSCTTCKPECKPAGCAGVKCGGISRACPDGSIASCQQACYEGTCIECTPDCAPPVQQENQSTQDDQEAERNETQDNSQGSSPNEGQNTSQNDSSASRVMFFEIMYDTAASGEKDEWVKLYNPSDSDVSLAGWTISDNSGTWKFGDSVIRKNSYLVLARNSSAFQQSFDCLPDVSGFSRQLNNDGDQLTLKDSAGSEQDFVAWEKGAGDAHPSWNISAKQGKSLLRGAGGDTDAPGDWMEAEPKAC